MTEYPHDRFDDVPEYTDRAGGHRAHFEPRAQHSGLRWIALFAALALAVGAFSYFVLPTLLGSPGQLGPNSPGAAPAGPPTSASPSPSVSPSATETSADAEPTEPTAADTDTDTATATPTPEEESTETPSPAPAEETSPEPTTTPTEETALANVSVEVYNATSINGLAAQTTANLSGAGFTVSSTANWAGFPVSSSAVYYSQGEATAQAVAVQLGLPLVYDARIPGVAVVLAGPPPGGAG